MFHGENQGIQDYAAPLIAEGFREGGERAPRQTDIFVYPDAPLNPDDGFAYLDDALNALGVTNRDTVIKKAVSDFVKDTRGLISHCDNVIILDHHGDLRGEKRGKAVKTWHPQSGLLPVSSLGQFIDLLGGINPQDTFRIHGAEFGQCPTRFAEQLLVLTRLGRFYGPSCVDPYDGGMDTDSAISMFDPSFDELRKLIMQEGLFRNSAIRFGSMFDGMGIAAVGSITSKDINTQLIDNRTRIYPNVN